MPRLLNINSYHYRRGGADVVYLEHARLFASLGWDCSYFAMRHPSNLECPDSRYFVDEIQIGHDYSLAEKVVKATQVIYSFEAQRQLRRLIADKRPDVAHAHNIYHHLSPSILPELKRAGIPTVLTAHDLKLACPNNKMLANGRICEACRGHRYHQVVRQRCVHGSLAASAVIAMEAVVNTSLGTWRRHIDRIVVPSRFLIDKLAEWGWPRDRFTYIPNYVDAGALEPRFEPGDYLVYFGRLSIEKGLPTVVAAAAESDSKVVLVGTGPIEDSLREAVVRTGARVEFAGYRTGDALHRLVRESRASILASEVYENAPLGVLESFAMGKPVIGSAIGGIPEMVRHGETGWLFESGHVEQLADRMRAAVQAPDTAIEAMGRAARADVEARYSRKHYIASMRALYHELGVA
ncbi:MAG: glycosyltransferase family 4 protein [Burkholderiales bacterium]|jgi:glycosyltransferase involved in cell wall biosynthesis